MWCRWLTVELQRLVHAPGCLAVLTAGVIVASSGCDTEDGSSYVFDPDSVVGEGGQAGDRGNGGGRASTATGGSGGTQAANGGSAGDLASGGEPPMSSAGSDGETPSEGGERSTGGAGAAGAPFQSEPEGGSGGSGGMPVVQGGSTGMGGSAATGGSGMDPEQDTTAPSVVSTTPDDGDDEVPGSTTIEVVFSEPLAEDSVTDDSFSVTHAGKAVSGLFDLSGSTLTFTPSERLTLLGEYSVTLTSDLTDVAGNPLDGPYDFEFRMADGEWKPVVTLAGGLNPQVALDRDGNGVVAWHDSNANLWAAATDNDDGFGTPVQLILSTSASEVRVAMLGSRSAVVVWLENSRVRASRFNGSAWSAPTYIDQGAGADSASGLVMATNQDGVAVAAWISWEATGSVSTMFASRLTTSAFGVAVPITTTASLAPVLSMSPNGTATLLSVSTTTETDTVWVSRSTGSTWSSPATIDTIPRKDPARAAVTMAVSQRALVADGEGNLLGVWTIYTSGAGSDAPVEARYARASATGTWGTPTAFGDRRGGVALGGAADGSAVAIFGESLALGVQFLRYTPAAGWAQLNSFGGTPGGRGGVWTSIAADALGNGLAVWSIDGVNASRFVAGAAQSEWSTPATTLAAVGAASQMSVGLSRVGAGIAAWGSGSSTVAARFDF